MRSVAVIIAACLAYVAQPVAGAVRNLCLWGVPDGANDWIVRYNLNELGSQIWQVRDNRGDLGSDNYTYAFKVCNNIDLSDLPWAQGNCETTSGGDGDSMVF
jgi:hypothetical protein